MKVLVRGPLLSISGYGVHTRQLWKWARSKKDWDVRAVIVPWGQCTFHINPDSEDGLIGDIMERSGIDQNYSADLSFQVQLPDEWDPNLAKINVGVTAGIEASKCNQTWIGASAKMDRVIVPSEYSKVALRNGGLDPKKLFNVPEAITCSFENTPQAQELTGKMDSLSTDFNFLVFGQITAANASTDRKNTFNCIKWLCDEFKDKKDVGIILKTNMGRMTVQDRNVCEQIIRSAVNEVRTGQFPRIHIVHGLMDREELGALFTHPKVKALCAPTRGEGWGLPILDAASAGLPVIATGHSGHMDFMKHVKYLDLRYKIQEIPQELVDGRIWVPGAKWAEPEEKHFKSRVRKFYKQPHVPREWAVAGREKIIETFNIQSVMKKYDEVLGDLIDVS